MSVSDAIAGYNFVKAEYDRLVAEGQHEASYVVGRGRAQYAAAQKLLPRLAEFRRVIYGGDL